MTGPTLSFMNGFDEDTAFEVEAKGYYAGGVVEFPSGHRFRVCFYDPVRLAQDLETEAEEGEVCIAEPGLIIIPRVTRYKMEEAIAKLFQRGYFEHLRPLQ